MSSTRSTTRLQIAIIGAGLGGLSAAICLSQRGHSIHVFESASQLSELGAGIQIPPNAARILDRWGLGAALEQKAAVPTEENLRRYCDGTLVGQLRRRTKETFGYASMVIHRADFQRLLYDAATEYGVKFTFGKAVGPGELGLETSSEPDIRNADVVVAADGIASALRTRMVGDHAHFKPSLTGDTASRIVLDSAKLATEPQLHHLVQQATNNVWMGPKRHVVAYTIRDLRTYNVVLCGPGEAPVGKYNEPYSPSALSKEYSDFEPVVRGIIAKADTAHRWTISEVHPLPRWTDGRLVLLGDAAHAMMPYCAQGAAQSIEDAAVLGACLSRVRAKDDIAGQLRRYEDLRKPRVGRVQEVSRGNRFLYGLEDGEEQRERDARLGQSLRPAAADPVSQASDTHDRPEPDGNARFGSPEFSEWLYGVDVEREASN